MRYLLFAVLFFHPTAWAQEPRAKLPVPSEAALAESARVVAEVYKADYEKAKTPAAKVELAKKLLTEGVATKDDPPGQYVLFRIARDIYSQQGDLPGALEAVRCITAEFTVDAMQLKVDAATAAAKASKPAKAQLACAEQLLSLVNETVAADQYPHAKSIAELAVVCARGAESVELIKRATLKAKEVDDIAAAFLAVQQARETLDAKPTDPEANQAVGKFLCCVKGDWPRGVSMLALGSDNDFKAAAILELEAKPDSLKVGDAWWKVSESLEDLGKQRTQMHAASWYRRAIPMLSGLTKAKVESRLKSLPDATDSPAPNVAAAVKERDFGFSNVWINETYKTTIRKVGRSWVETSHTTGKVTLNYVEVDRNEKYVELFCVERKHKMRLLKSGKADFDGKGSWQWISNGHWEK
ncbi:hypothetical protein [Anatilimnocola floriformis]|uniref:hypothetical protein n=1 Tax=Anatilimnocola floriformis TaxID=2948575 RepID=UPI0020C51252|nr:hypothetical protein [Anatilimnocola floriformis]